MAEHRLIFTATGGSNVVTGTPGKVNEYLWEVPAGWTRADVLAVAGGGRGGDVSGIGGAGGGGVLLLPNHELVPGEIIPIIVGESTAVVGHGRLSRFRDIIVPGGGDSRGFAISGDGASGGGGYGRNESIRDGGKGAPGFGHDGGRGAANDSASSWSHSGGGGGGAGGPGGDSIVVPGLTDAVVWTGGHGGVGRYVGDIFGNDIGDDGWFGGGGTGSIQRLPLNDEDVPVGGKGGGGSYPSFDDTVDPFNGTGGGGAGNSGGFSANQQGRSGLVVIQAIGAVPSVECDITHIDRIVYDQARRAGIPGSRIDLAGLATDSDFGELWGLGIGRPATGRAVVEILQRYAFFDLADIRGRLIGKRRDRLPDGIIGGEDLRGHAYGETPPTLARRERDEDYELPRAVRVQYSQALGDYEPGSEGYSRRVTDAENVVDLDLTAIAMDPDKAAEIAEIATLEMIVNRESTDVTLAATDANKELIPSDIKTLQVRERQDVVRITELAYAYPGLMKLKLGRHDPSIYHTDAVGAGRRLPGSIPFVPGVTAFDLLDAPLIREHDNTTGYFAALGGNPTVPGLVEGWPGGDLQRLEPGGWEDIARVLRPGNVFGAATNALPDAQPHYVTDDVLTVTANGILESATLQQVAFGANLAALEVRSGGNRAGWELIRFLGAAAADGVWTLTGIVRGVNGTEWATGMHQIGDRFILLGGEAQILAGIEELNLERQHNAVTLGQEPDPINVRVFAWAGVDLIPYSPAHLKAERDSNDDILLEWTRRDRIGNELQSGQTLPMSEDTEAYEVDIYDTDGTTVLRTIAVSTPEATYTEAQQTSDFGSLPTELDWDVRQMGELGRGYARRSLSEGL